MQTCHGDKGTRKKVCNWEKPNNTNTLFPQPQIVEESMEFIGFIPESKTNINI